VGEDLDPVARYGLALGFRIRARTVLVEGTTDVDLFGLAARLERAAGGVDLLDDRFTVVAAGQGDAGGTRGIIRELISLRAVARSYLTREGRPLYRFIALFDGDPAGKHAIKTAHELDTSIVEFKDVFRLWPVMPIPGSLDPGNMRKVFEQENAQFGGLDWELEDLLPQDFIDAFASERADAIRRTTTRDGMTHRDFTADGKARLHHFVKLHAVRDDLKHVVAVLKALRLYLNVK